jgi:hypothetical protein
MRDNKEKEYLNSVFGKLIWSDGEGNFIYSLGIQKEEFMDIIAGMEANENGFLNFKMSPQKSNPEKLSIWVDDFVPTQQKEAARVPGKVSYKKPSGNGGGRSGSYNKTKQAYGKSTYSKKTGKPVGKQGAAQGGDEDDLPF